ncbi:hypothetical protein GCM10023077_42340 [Mycolicibacterium helvum]
MSTHLQAFRNDSGPRQNILFNGAEYKIAATERWPPRSVDWPPQFDSAHGGGGGGGDNDKPKATPVVTPGS